MKSSRMRVVLFMALIAQVCMGMWWDEGGELDRLVVFGLQTNPRLKRFWHAAEQAGSDRVGLGDFWDPRLLARAGHAVDVDGEDRAWIGVGAETPVPILGYWGFTLEQGQAWPPPDAGVDHLHQSIVRVDWRLPLHRDRGFREWRLEDRIAVAEYEAAYARWLSALQALRLDISLAYVAVLEKHAALDVTGAALERAERLQSEAEALSELQSIPAYQTAAARLEAVLRREEQVAARQALEVEEWRLLELLGSVGDSAPTWSGGPATLLRLALQAPPIPDGDFSKQALNLGERRENLALRQAVNHALDLAVERRRSDISLFVKAAFLGEDPDKWPADSSWRHDRAGSLETLLVWSRPWGNTGREAEAARLRSSIAGLEERENELVLENLVLKQTALGRYRAAVERLQLVSAAVEAAEGALRAEEERFRLGEGRSRNVLDAQKDLTDTMRRQIAMAAELLRASVQLHYSLGFMPRAQWESTTKTASAVVKEGVRP